MNCVVKKPIDSFKLACTWNDVLLPKSAVLRVPIEGLLLQGSGFADGGLASLPADAPSLCGLPPCVLAFITNEDPEPHGDPNSSISVPVYYSITREDLVCSIRVPCKGDSSEWILSGSALFLSHSK